MAAVSVFVPAETSESYAATLSGATGAVTDAELGESGLAGTTAGIQSATEVALELYGDQQKKGKKKGAHSQKKYMQINEINSLNKESKKSGADSLASDQSVSEAAAVNGESMDFAEALAWQCRYIAGGYEFDESSRFFIVTDDAKRLPPDDVADTVKLMAAQFASYGLPAEEPLQIVYGTEDNAAEGDIVIALKSEEEFKTEIDESEDTGRIDTADINETYRLVTGDTVRLTACDADGIYYGLLTLMEIAKETADAKTGLSGETSGAAHGSITMQGLSITDGPDLAERTVMLDCGRKYFSKEWIKNFIRRASMQRYNTIALHFSEAEGLRFDSEKFPWLTKNNDSLTRDEMAEIVRLAHSYHMDVIPSFDSPGHNTFIVRRYAEYVKKHPDFSFTFDGETYDSSIRGFGSIANHYSHNGSTKEIDYAGIDITKIHAVAFIYALADEYGEFFRSLGCDRFDIGGDEVFGWYSFSLGGASFNFNNRWKSVDHWAEYARKKLGIKNGSASDAYINYLNELAEMLEKKGFRCRVFNDEIDLNGDQHLDLDESIDVTFWKNQGQGAKHYADEGHRVFNFVEDWCFYVVRRLNGKDIMNSRYKTVTAKNIFENWEPRSFNRTPGKWRPVSDEAMGGGYFAIWCDQPEYKKRSVIWSETEFKTWANASRMWNVEVNSNKSGTQDAQSYDEMKAFASMMDGFAGFSGDPEEDAELAEVAEPADAGSWWQELTAGRSYN